MADFGLKTASLTPDTWPAYAALIERHNGVFGGCWCLGFHSGGNKWRASVEERRAFKHELVLAGKAHAGLVFAGEDCVGWCQFGSPAELPDIKNRKAYEAELGPLPDWRITCFFVDRSRRRQGVARAALGAALDAIGALGGGRVEAYPEDAGERKVTPVALHGGSLRLFEDAGFVRQRQIGKNKFVVHRVVDAIG